MIRLDWNNTEGQIGALMSRFNELPRHIAKKHLLAVIKRVGKDGVAILKANTPKGPTRTVNGSRIRGGALRRAAIVKAKYQGRNADGYAYGVLGYKYGPESRKALWLEFGTSRGIQPRGMIARTMAQWGGPAKTRLQAEMAAALEKAAKELASGMNPTRVYSAGGSWRPG